MKIIIKRLYLLAVVVIGIGILWADSLFAATGTGTPETYEVTVKKVELRNQATGTFVTVREADLTFNIASAAAGATVGSYISGSAIPEGTYDQVRVTISRNMGMKSTGTVGGTTYYSTSTSKAIPGDLGNAIEISTDSNQYAKGTIQIPSNVTGVDATAGTFVNTETLASPIVVKKGLSMSVTIKFDVTGKATFDDVGLVCYPVQPGVSVE